MKALDLANYIVWYANKYYPEISFTHVKLQKILYYVTTSYLKTNPQSDFLFSENIEKWQFGPVVSSVYNEFKTYGGKAITLPASEIVFSESDLDFDLQEFDPDLFESSHPTVADLSKKVIKALIHKDAFSLVDMTHKEQAWISVEPLIKARDTKLFYSLDELRKATKVI